jgi:hypothetical protein
MIPTVITIAGHLVDRILCDETGGAFTMPPLYPSIYQFRLKLIARGDDGELALVHPDVTGISASIGLIYAEPRAGTFKLCYDGGTPTAPIMFNEDAEDFKDKLGALTESTTNHLAEVYQPTPSTWMCRFDNPPIIPILLQQAPGNDLEPETFVRVRQFYQGDQYWAEIRLMQGPIASTSALGTVLSAPPEVTEIRAGYIDTSDPLQTIIINEVQSIYIPPGFRGTYILHFQGRQTRPLSALDGSANIELALNALYTDQVHRFTVSNPQPNTAYVEFVGPLAGQDVDNLGLTLSAEDHLDLGFTLDLFTTEVAEALRTKAEVEASFEVMLRIADGDNPTQDIVLFQAPVTVLRPLHWEGLVEASPINWLLPPNPTTYVPFVPGQVITGHQSEQVSIGDGIARTFVINHSLNSPSIDVAIRENEAGGRLLKDNEFDVTFDTDMALTITFPPLPAPAPGPMVVLLISHGDMSQFINHGHSIEQIEGLFGIIEEILVRLSNLEAILPTQPPVTPPGGGTFGTPATGAVVSITIPDIWNVVPTNRLPGKDKPTPDKLPSQGLLLPAVHESIDLGLFTADVTTHRLTLTVPTVDIVSGQRVRIDPGEFIDQAEIEFIAEDDTILYPSHGIQAGRRVRFTGEGFPTSVAHNFTYYVVNPTTDTFQISSIKDGNFLAITANGDLELEQRVALRPEPPAGLDESIDYFVLNPTGSPTASFQLSATLITNPTPPPATIPGDPILFTDIGFPSMTISTIPDAPDLVGGHLPDLHLPGNDIYTGHAYSIRETVQLMGGRGIRATTVKPGDIVASDGRLWYPVTRSDVPGKNSFYAVKMENEIFRFAVNDKMLAPGCTLTCIFDLEIRMYKHTSNIQYMLVVEYADLPVTTTPAPTGPNIYAVDWSNRTPIVQQNIVVTELSFIHQFGVQVIRTPDGRMATNKKAYGVEIGGDSCPPSPNFAIRGRLIEFDTEDNIKDAQGLVYYAISKASAQITKNAAPTVPP